MPTEFEDTESMLLVDSKLEAFVKFSVNIVVERLKSVILSVLLRRSVVALFSFPF